MIVKILAIVLALLLIGAMAGCAVKDNKDGENTEGYKHISQDEAKKMIELDDGHVIVDVRRESEYKSGHIPGAILVPNESIKDEKPEALPDTNQIILVYCRSGVRSKMASKKLAELGYTNVYEFGGLLTWDGELVKESE